jgi:hypothetical protein
MTPNFPPKTSPFSTSPKGFYNQIQPTQIKFVAGFVAGLYKNIIIIPKYNFNLLITNKLKLYLGDIY